MNATQERPLPIITWPGYEDTIPPWILELIVKQRQGKPPDECKATDAEALAYLMGASLAMPLGTQWSNIYIHCFNLAMDAAGKPYPHDLQAKPIGNYEQSLLNSLKDWIYRKQRQSIGKKAKKPIKESKCR